MRTAAGSYQQVREEKLRQSASYRHAAKKQKTKKKTLPPQPQRCANCPLRQRFRPGSVESLTGCLLGAPPPPPAGCSI